MPAVQLDGNLYAQLDSTCPVSIMQIRRRFLNIVGDEASLPTVFGANFSAGFAAGSLAAAFTCPLDVARTRRQIEVISPYHAID